MNNIPLHWRNIYTDAITGKTAAEIVYASADRTKGHMGLTTWKSAADGRILKSDVGIAKFFAFRQYGILKDKVCVSRAAATVKAQTEYGAFNTTQPIESDFDRMVRQLGQKQARGSDE